MTKRLLLALGLRPSTIPGAADVDTASYDTFRSYALSGTLPASERVQLEEFVNFFNDDEDKVELRNLLANVKSSLE
jgi:hypothetical protein